MGQRKFNAEVTQRLKENLELLQMNYEDWNSDPLTEKLKELKINSYISKVLQSRKVIQDNIPLVEKGKSGTNVRGRKYIWNMGDYPNIDDNFVNMIQQECNKLSREYQAKYRDKKNKRDREDATIIPESIKNKITRYAEEEKEKERKHLILPAELAILMGSLIFTSAEVERVEVYVISGLGGCNPVRFVFTVSNPIIVTITKTGLLIGSDGMLDTKIEPEKFFKLSISREKQEFGSNRQVVTLKFN